MQRPRPRRLRFLPLAPVAVIVLGVATALVVAMVGVRQLARQADRAAELRARLVSQTLASRLRATDPERREALLRAAARAPGVRAVVVEKDGGLRFGSSEAALPQSALSDLVLLGFGETQTGDGRGFFHATPLRPPLHQLTVIAFVSAPSTPRITGSLVQSVAALTAILIGVAALVAFALARDVQSEVEFVRGRIVTMANQRGDPAGQPVPVRSIDHVGILTSAFNLLVERFAAAESAYRQDLTDALAADRGRSAFLAALSHELRTPLNAILGFTDVLLSEVDGPLSADARENLEVVRSSGDHLRALIDDILDLSALESGELELQRREVDLLPIAEEVVREARGNAQGKPLEVELRAESTLVWGDPRRIRQILGNVVGNAVKFTTEGKVVLEVGPDRSWASIQVTDTGPGIAPEDQAAIFEEYRQAGDAGVHRVGTGLGLAITRRLVLMHQGTIDLESRLGEGSCFKIWLPRQAPEPEGTAEPGVSGTEAERR